MGLEVPTTRYSSTGLSVRVRRSRFVYGPFRIQISGPSGLLLDPTSSRSSPSDTHLLQPPVRPLRRSRRVRSTATSDCWDEVLVESRRMTGRETDGVP